MSDATAQAAGLGPEENRRIARLLFDLGRFVRDSVVAGRRSGGGLESVDRVAASDTIYRIDRFGEDALLEWFEARWPDDLPADIVAEGLGDETGERFPRGASEARFTVLIDPIDGTRGLMYDKRSAWVLAGAAFSPQGRRPVLDDLAAGAMVEIPTTRQNTSDAACAWREANGGFAGEAARDRDDARRPEPLALRSSGAADLRHGFATFASFFPEGRVETARIEEAFLRRHLPETPSPTPLVFTDQYISSGGQIFELLSGRERMVADLRPLVFEKLGLPDCLSCHPYDLACLPVARASGCVLEDPMGGPIRAPLDTTTPVAWVGYANRKLAGELGPLLREALAECGY